MVKKLNVRDLIMDSLTVNKLDEITYEVVGAAIEVHKTMGRGLMESVYQECLKEEMKFRKMNFVAEFKIPVTYKTKELNLDFRCDLFVESCLVVELKATNEFNPFYEAQLLTYMKLLRAPKGILINFNCGNIFKDGQKTYVYEYFKILK